MSSSEQDRVRELAERVARRLGATRRARRRDARAAARATTSPRCAPASPRFSRRLAHIESHITHGEDCEHERDRAVGRRGARVDVRLDSGQRRAGADADALDVAERHLRPRHLAPEPGAVRRTSARPSPNSSSSSRARRPARSSRAASPATTAACAARAGFKQRREP